MVNLQVFCFKFELIRCTIPAFQRVLFDFPGQEGACTSDDIIGGNTEHLRRRMTVRRRGEEEYDWDERQENGNDNGLNDYENYDDFL